MSTLTDLTIPYSALEFDGDARAVLKQGAHEHDVLSALLIATVCRFGRVLADGAETVPVSTTIDVTGVAEAGKAVEFDAKVDRKTRTLLFIGGEAAQAGKPLLKATAVYRIV